VSDSSTDGAFIDGVRPGHRLAAGLICLAVAGFVSNGSLAEDECGKLASVQNQVETRRAETSDWKSSTLDEVLFDGDRVRTGEASRAAILYSDQTLHRINANSEVEVLPPSAGNPGVLRVLSGQHYFSSRKPKDYGRIETPTVTAAIRGTEFVVDIAADGTTTITMVEGLVDASNSFGSVQVRGGEAAFVQPGKAPVRRVGVRPKDAAAWSLYYPRVLGGADADRLRSMGAEGLDLVRAAELLSAGQVTEASSLIEKARQRDGNNPVALALASVIEVTADRKQEASTLARQAVESDPDSAAAALAMSFASQAEFDIAKARKMAETAARLDPDSAEALARVAELRLAEGDTKGAKEAAERAVRRDPDSARALTVLGFVELAQLKSARALETFARAVTADPGFPLARLGHGLARLRRGDLHGGREEMQTAAILDPDNSLLRSYLSKAYYEERRKDEAEKELAAAKELDPLDPTPHLYDAILKQTYNRPVEAMKDLHESVKLNDNRAVYRSRLLLDEDLAVRSADMANIYNDLGFEQLGLVTARRSADSDQSNYSSHLFLAGSYRNLRGFAPAFLSETLQARIYQPVSVNAVRPDVVNESVSFNEYTALFDRPRVRGFASATYGNTDTSLDEYFSDGDICLDPGGNVGPCQDLIQLDQSNPRGGDATLTFNRDRFAGAISYQTFKDEGFRVNNDIESDTVRAFFAFAPSHRDQFQVNVIDGRRETGDLPLRGFPGLIGLERIETELTNIGLGYHRVISPAADLAISAIYSDTQQNLGISLLDLGSVVELLGSQIEAQYVLRKNTVTWTAGAGHFDGEQKATGSVGGLDPVTSQGDDGFDNAYFYAKIRRLGPVEINAGASYENVLAPLGLLPPRDSNILPGDVAYEDNQVSPKFGLSAYPTPTTVVRATAYGRLTPAIGRLQTLEPTQVSGFNQFFDDPGGTSSVNYGVGLDQRFARSIFFGFSVLRRNLDIPEPSCDSPFPNSGCAFQPATGFVERNSEDWLGNFYFNATAGKRVAVSLEYAYEERDFDFTQVSNNSLFEDYVETRRLRPEVRLFLPMGFFAVLRGTQYNQEVQQFDDLTSPARSTIEADFWIGDLQLGYRLPKRWGSVVLNAFNFNNEKFEYYLSSLEEDVVPTRTVTLGVNFTSP
jgi:tetratricopeptide (TPR) repeat protein